MAEKTYFSKEKMAELLTLLKSKIPTKTSQLNNDSNFVEDADYVHTDNNYTNQDKTKLQGLSNYTLPTASSTVKGGVKIGANIAVAEDGTISVTAVSWDNVQGKPTKLSQFTNDSGFITKTATDLVNYYAKSESYSKAEVNALIGDLKTIQIEKVTQLPSTGESNKIYLVPANPEIGDNHHIEYIWVDTESRFEPIGDTKIDLTNYWSKSELREVTTPEVNSLFAGW